MSRSRALSLTFPQQLRCSEWSPSEAPVAPEGSVVAGPNGTCQSPEAQEVPLEGSTGTLSLELDPTLQVDGILPMERALSLYLSFTPSGPRGNFDVRMHWPSAGAASERQVWAPAQAHFPGEHCMADFVALTGGDSEHERLATARYQELASAWPREPIAADWTPEGFAAATEVTLELGAPIGACVYPTGNVELTAALRVGTADGLVQHQTKVRAYRSRDGTYELNAEGPLVPLQDFERVTGVRARPLGDATHGSVDLFGFLEPARERMSLALSLYATRGLERVELEPASLSWCTGERRCQRER